MGKKRRAEELAKAKSELAQIESAITAIISGAQSYGIGTRNVRKADLAELYKRKAVLEDSINSLSGRSRFRRVVVKDY